MFSDSGNNTRSGTILIDNFMISGQSKKLKQTLGGYKYMRNEKITSSHPQTAHLWKLGDGKIPKKNIKVSGWNINGVRAAIRKNALVPFVDG